MPQRTTRVRYLIISILFAVSCFSYGDRVALSIAGAAMAKDIALDPVRMGYLFSGFSWAYVLGQLPSGVLLDRFGSKLVYGLGIVLWSICAMLTGFAGYLTATACIYRDLPAAPGGRFRAGPRLSWQWPHCGLLVSRRRARPCFRDLQCFAILRVDDLRSHPGVDHAFRRLAKLLLVHGRAGPALCPDLGPNIYDVQTTRASPRRRPISSSRAAAWS